MGAALGSLAYSVGPASAMRSATQSQYILENEYATHITLVALGFSAELRETFLEPIPGQPGVDRVLDRRPHQPPRRILGDARLAGVAPDHGDRVSHRRACTVDEDVP